MYLLDEDWYKSSCSSLQPIYGLLSSPDPDL